MKPIAQLIEEAVKDWSDCDWTHEYRGPTSGSPSGDGTEYCDGDEEDCTYCADARGDAEAAQVYGEEALAALAAGRYYDAIRDVRAARSLASSWGDAGSWGDAAHAIAALEHVTDVVLVETMPEQYRESHTAAGNDGAYPDNGVERMLMTRAEAEVEVEADPDWTSIVRPARASDWTHYEMVRP